MSDRHALQQEALAFLAPREREVIDLTCALVAAPTPNPPGDESAAANVVHEALRRYGLPEATVVAKEPRRPNLIVRIDGAHPGPNLGLCGHLDTKPVGEAAAEWRTPPWEPTEIDGRLYGLGSTDMKGAVAAMILAGAAFQSVADRAAGSLTLIFTADEELGSIYGAKHLAETTDLGIDALILGEPSGVREDWDGLRIVSRGVCCFKVFVRGTQTHSSISDQLPNVNAVEAMATVLGALRRDLRFSFPEHPYCPTGPTINLGVRAQGGVGWGVIAGHAEFWTDVRTTPGMTFEAFDRDLRAALDRAAALVPGATVTLEYMPGLSWAPATEIAADHPAVQAAQIAAREVLGRPLELKAFPGGTDAIYFQAAAGIPTIASFGPGLLPPAHGPNEWITTSSIVEAARMYAVAALTFGAGETA